MASRVVNEKPTHRANNTASTPSVMRRPRPKPRSRGSGFEGKPAGEFAISVLSLAVAACAQENGAVDRRTFLGLLAGGMTFALPCGGQEEHVYSGGKSN